MTRICSILSLFFLCILLAAGCGSDGSSEAKSIIKQQVSATENYVNGLDGAKSADDVIKAVNNYTKDMKKLIPDLKAFQKKYPEFHQGKVPEGMEKEMAKLQEVSEKIPGAMMKTASFMMDARVQEAMTRMGQEMSRLQ